MSSNPSSGYSVDSELQLGHTRLYNNYFGTNPAYSGVQFRRRFRMQRRIFLRIMEALGNHSPYFQERLDASCHPGLSPLQKCTTAVQMLANGGCPDADDLQIEASTAVECLKEFVEGVNSVYGEEYLRRPNAEDRQRLIHAAEGRGFPGMLGSIDCLEWEWKNSPAAWKIQGGKATIMVEATASYDLWIWHAFFGISDACHNIHVLDESPFFEDTCAGVTPSFSYVVNGNTYNSGYYLTDGIYPERPMYVHSIAHPKCEKTKLFARRHDEIRKDVERAFEALHSRFAIVCGSQCISDVSTLGKIIRTCIILHNMIVEDERDIDGLGFDSSSYDQTEESSTWQYSKMRSVEHEAYIRNKFRLA